MSNLPFYDLGFITEKVATKEHVYLRRPLKGIPSVESVSGSSRSAFAFARCRLSRSCRASRCRLVNSHVAYPARTNQNSSVAVPAFNSAAITSYAASPSATTTAGSSQCVSRNRSNCRDTRDQKLFHQPAANAHETMYDPMNISKSSADAASRTVPAWSTTTATTPNRGRGHGRAFALAESSVRAIFQGWFLAATYAPTLARGTGEQSTDHT